MFKRGSSESSVSYIGLSKFCLQSNESINCEGIKLVRMMYIYISINIYGSCNIDKIHNKISGKKINCLVTFSNAY